MRALAVALEGMGRRVVFPKWFLSLSKRGREALCGYEEMEVGHFSTLLHRDLTDLKFDHRNTC